MLPNRIPPQSAAQTGRPLVVLVIEDDETDRLRLIKLCRRAGLQADFHCAADLTQMRRLMDDQRFDLVLIDYHLGLGTGQDALDLLQSHKAQAGAVPIMVTSVEKPGVIIKSMRAGCADYLLKEDLSVEAIRTSVMSALERYIDTADTTRPDPLHTAHMPTRASSEPEMRRIMSAMLWRIRTMDKIRGQAKISVQRHKLEELCLDLIGQLDTGTADLSPCPARHHPRGEASA